MQHSIFRRALGRIGQIQVGEAATAFLMLAYSFLAMASYNAIKPITRSKFIDSLGADNLPYVQLSAGVLIGVTMVAYSWLMARLPRRWSLPIVQAGIVGLLVAFWFLFRAGGTWVSVAFYITGLILGILLISQFWTLANLVYDPRQAKRLFGFIGAGAPLGGIAGSILTVRYVKQMGSVNIILFSAALMTLCVVIVVTIIVREQLSGLAAAPKQETKIRPWQAIDLLRNSKHLQIISLVIAFAAIGAAIIEQQLNMAAAAAHGQESAIASFLALVQAWTSSIGFLVQILLTSRIHRFLGIGFALLILPVSLGSTGLLMLMIGSLWAPALARVLDQSLRYTVDKTSREILFMPLPSDIKLQAKPFVDVTVDRFAKGFGALILLLLIKPWGLHLSWQKLSYASLTMTVLWIAMALRARRGYVEAFRSSLGNQQIKPAEIRREMADLSTLEALVAELSDTDHRKVLYAIEILESLGKQNLITPLLLLHESSSVRLRALSVIDGVSPDMAARWLPSVRRLLTDPDPEVRASAVGALANIQTVDVLELVRPSLSDSNPRIAMTAAMVLARSGTAEDIAAAEGVLEKLRTDPRDTTVEVRRELAALLRHIPDMRFRRLLIPLLMDSSQEVVEEALHSVRQLGNSDYIFVPVLISLLRHPRLRQNARDLLVSYGEATLDTLGHFLGDQDEHPAVRRNIPSVIAKIPCPRATDLLLGALTDPDRHLRFEAVAGLEAMRRRYPGLSFRHEPVEPLIVKECEKSAQYTTLRQNCFGSRMPDRGRLLGRALAEKEARSIDRIFRLLGLILPWQDIVAAQWSIERGGPGRARALEYLDNVLSGPLRKSILPILEHSYSGTATLPSGRSGSAADEAVQADSLRKLIRDPDPVISAAAIHFVWETRQRQYQKDLESLTASPNHTEWWLAEEASWTLRGLRLAEESQSELLLEPLPAVEIAARLGKLPLFASVSADELIRVACAGRLVRHQYGAIIYHDGTIADHVQFLMQGRVVRREPSGTEQSLDAPASLSFEELLEDRPITANICAATPCICLSFTLAELQAVMAESRAVVEGLLRMLCVSMPKQIADPVVQRTAAPNAVAGTTIDPIAKATLLEALPVFSQVSRQEMLALTSIVSEVNALSGTQLFAETDPPAVHLLIFGSVSLESTEDEPAVCAGAGDAVGLYQTLAGIPLIRQGRCLEDSRLLRMEREDLLDLLMQRPELQRQLLRALFRGSQLPSSTTQAAAVL